jgi:hypothetical protein
MANFEVRLDGQTVAKIEIDTNLLRRLLGGGRAGETAIVTAANSHQSVALTTAEARELVAKAGKSMAAYLRRFAEEHGAITWGETKHTFDVKSWDEFSAGPLKKLERTVQRITGDKGGALIWRVEHEWLGLEKGEDEVCRLHVDGPALAALKAVVS